MRIPFEEAARAHGTPFYLYDAGAIRARLARFRRAFEGVPAEVLYAVKANPCAALMRMLAPLADGADVASIGEVHLARAAGFARLSFAGPGKTAGAIAEAVALGATISAESPREVRELPAGARVALRVNPSRRLHAFAVPISGTPSPFGVDQEDLDEAARALLERRGALDFEGVHVHPGSQCTSWRALLYAVEDALAIAGELEARHGLASRSVNFGGGLGAGADLDLEALAGGVKARLERRVARFELGRWLVADAGTYVARVVSTKRSRGKTFFVLDGGMSHCLAATGLLTGPRAPRLPVVNLSRPDAPRVRATVAGPACTPLDVLGDEIEPPAPELGDLLAVPGTGAYGYTLSPLLFLGHAPPKELLWDGGELIPST